MTPDHRYNSRLDLACEPSAARYARSHTRDLLQRWGLAPGIVDDALTIVSELVSNAARHAGGEAKPLDGEHGRPRARMCSLSLRGLPEHLYLAVFDEEVVLPPVRRLASENAETGRGLALVEALTEGDWGWVPSVGQPGKSVWARIKVPVPGAQTGDQTHRPSAVSA